MLTAALTSTHIHNYTLKPDT